MNAPDAPPWTWKSTLVCVFVSAHLAILLFRNPIDLWRAPMEEWAKDHGCAEVMGPIDTWTERYENVLGIEQGWCMFRPPIARNAPFLAARLQFTDGTSELIVSDNERGRDFLRSGGWRQRKLEDYLVRATPDKLPEDRELPLWEAYARWRIETWKAQHPGDPRQVERVELVERRFALSAPDERPEDTPAPKELAVGTFGPDGKLR
jgi:hypothetical protein